MQLRTCSIESVILPTGTALRTPLARRVGSKIGSQHNGKSSHFQAILLKMRAENGWRGPQFSVNKSREFSFLMWSFLAALPFRFVSLNHSVYTDKANWTRTSFAFYCNLSHNVLGKADFFRLCRRASGKDVQLLIIMRNKCLFVFYASFGKNKRLIHSTVKWQPKTRVRNWKKSRDAMVEFFLSCLQCGDSLHRCNKFFRPIK